MRRRATLLTLGLLCAIWIPALAADKDSGISGKWATDAVVTARRSATSGSIRSLIDSFKTLYGAFPTIGNSPDGVALTMELKHDKNRLSGWVADVVDDITTDVKEARVLGNKFEFATYRKVNNRKVATIYKGDLVDAITIHLTRFTISGQPVDPNPDGTPETLIFHRAK